MTNMAHVYPVMLGLTAEIFHFSGEHAVHSEETGQRNPKKTFCQVHDVPLLRQALAPPLPGFGM